MPSYYSIVQYVPDPLADERINVGVVAFDDDRVVSRHLHSWRRVQSFTGHSVDHLRSIVAEILGDDLSPDEVRKAIAEWDESIQFTRPRASLVDPGTLLDTVYAQAVTDREPQSRKNTKARVIRAGRVALERAVHQKLASSELDVESSLSVQGERGQHDADLALRNGRVLLVAKAISFDRQNLRDVERDIGATAWFLDDLNNTPNPPDRAVLVGPRPSERRSEFNTGIKLFQSLNAQVVREADIDSWAGEVVDAYATGS